MRRLSPCVVVSCFVLGACPNGPQLVTPPAPEPDSAIVAASVYLIGDAGAPKPGDPVLGALAAELRSRVTPATVVFLGDNIYPTGVPEDGDPDRAEAERRLLAQVEVLRGTDARGIFVPGNHDWGRSAPDGWARLLRQQLLIEAQGLPTVSLVPSDGCPGPETVRVAPNLRLIVLDTQWWLHPHARPTDPESNCTADTMDEVTAQIRGLVNADSGWVGIVAHHPMATGGVHGGHFSVMDHLFPLRALKSWLWIPLPIIGSTYPIARMSGISNQDLSGPKYRELADSLRTAFAGGRVVFYAAGHEHNLQVLQDSTFGHVLVSGAGYFDHTSRTVYVDQSRYAEAASGYMRVDVLTDGRFRLGVMIVSEDGGAREAFSMWLHTAPED